MLLYELTDKGRALLTKPRHPEPTNYEHCCSCCVILEKENKELKQELQIWADDREENSNG